jgi:hypothetical protein
MTESEEELRQQLKMERIFRENEKAKSEELARRAKSAYISNLALITLLLACAIVFIIETA